MKILVINAGSSSLKYQLIDMPEEKVLAKGACDRIGLEGSVFTYECEKTKERIVGGISDHRTGLNMALRYILDGQAGVIGDVHEIDAVGHRISNSGSDVNACIMIDDAAIKRIEDHFYFAPLHNPAYLACIRSCREAMPDVPMTVLPDAAFFSAIPDKAAIYGLPYDYYESYGIKKFGYHGISHKYVCEKGAELINEPLENLRVISCHLGSGSSISAIDKGVAVENSMGFTPLEGLAMGTRCGAIDASALLYLINDKGVDPKELSDILHYQSGLLGISGISSDVRVLKEESKKGNARAKLALEIFSYRVKKYIGEYSAVLGGLDLLIFTAGIGENDHEMRKAVTDGLEYLGVEIDEQKNKNGKEAVEISKDGAPVKVLVVSTEEELEIARETYALIAEI